MIKKLLITYIILGLTVSSNSSINDNSQHDFIIKYENELLKDKTDLFNETIEFIKQHEGFRKYPYICLGGYRTNGYGFITKYLPYKYRDSISKADANIVLVSKLKRCLKYANKIYPNLNYSQSLAVAHLGYAKGFGSIRRHELHRMLLEGSVNDSTWLYFSKYEVKYKSYRNNRLYELKTFKK